MLALAVAAAAYLLTPTRYVVTTSMLLTTPAAGGTLNADPDVPVGLTNPLLQFSDGLRTTSGMLILAMNGPEVQRDLGVVEGGPAEVTIDDGRSNPDLLGISGNGPFIYVKVDSDSATTARMILERARQRISAELVERQRMLRAPTSTHISILDVVPPTAPKAEIEGKVQMAGVGLVLTVVLGFGIAYLAQRRGLFERRRAAAAAASGEPQEEPPVVDLSSSEPEEDGPSAEEDPEPSQNGAAPAPDPGQNGAAPARDPGQNGAAPAVDPSQNGAAEMEDSGALLVSDDGMPTGPIEVIRVGAPRSSTD
ncbi:hypothetical protein EDD27_9545 [Nonomuraea polychroma]|uniref:Capsular polysaccharide biosynthesis protein n=1 Tax=Nonomuraea polychroma TaxID=46176 RepID=A0A438MLM1_9ACTN|nr:hypothetical protein [Nonomuraea polychroma]RVX46653.1 hypothetical protein EDD27_9545 [Nonomuraea polychroma]